MSKTLKILFIGDIVGQPGRKAVRDFLPQIQKEEMADLVVANGENAAGGFGLTGPVIDELLEIGVDIITSGNHIWDKKEILNEIGHRPYVLRPANYPPGAPGLGHCLIDVDGLPVGVLNLSGRVFMGPMDCPFQAAERLVGEMRATTPVILVDMHAEATSEKQAMGWFLDGRVSAVVGTHTHVQTSDARILPKGTGYLTDAGMTGPTESIIGVNVQEIVTRFLTQMPVRFETAKNHPQLEGVLFTVDKASGRTLSVVPMRRGGSPRDNRS